MSQSEGSQISSGTYAGKMEATTTVGCFSTPTPLVDHGSYEFQSSGNCQKVCYQLQQPVMGLTSGTNCSCGALLPPKDSQVDDDNCNTGCAGYDKESCGGGDYWWVILTGYSRNQIANLDPKSESSTISSHTVVTVGGQTVVKTVPDPSATSAQSQKSSGSSGGGGGSKVGIAVGVVVGVLVLLALIGGVLLFLRRRKRKLREEEYNQKQSVQNFVNGGKNPFGTNSQTSMNDSRLDPEVMMSRRQSDGSIADNQDYSRRILRVANPDGH